MKPMSLGRVFDAALRRGWAMDRDVFAQFVEILERHVEGAKLDPSALAAIAEGRRADLLLDLEDGPREVPRGYTRQGSVGIVPVRGVIARHAAQVNGLCQDAGTSVEQLRGDLAAAMADAKARTVVLAIDSPGGSVEGIPEFADELRAARERKPIVAHGEGLMASAAYWLGSQAGEVYATRGTEVGSIGVIARVVDRSRMLGQAGIDTHYVTTARGKAVGAPGQAVRAEDLQDIRASLQPLHDLFLDDIAAGRRRPRDQVEPWGDGELRTAAAAQTSGLIDGVRTWDQLMAQLGGGAAGGTKTVTVGTQRGAAAADDPPRDNTVKNQQNQTDPAVEPAPAAAGAATPDVSRAAIDQAVQAAVDAERARVAGILRVATDALDGVESPIATIAREVIAATAKPAATAADTFGAVMKAVRALSAETAAAAAAPAPEAKATDRRSAAQRARAEASQDAEDASEEQAEDADADDTAEPAGDVDPNKPPPSPAQAITARARKQWARMSAAQRSEWPGGFKSFAGDMIGQHFAAQRAGGGR